ncbi:hypothetical protein ABZY31_27445 [Streptomyces sp. NPDC006529]|uniref:hypothetical protein n=1 Tax=Streptomyces sp. NPDC006529 TaxID=3157177 RepID=UPI0033BA3F71
MSTVRRTLVRAAAVTACAGSLLALPAVTALADGLPAAAAAQTSAPARAASAPRTLVKSLTLADGVSSARVYRVAAGAYQADVLRDGVTVASLTSRDGVPGYGRTDALHLALQPDGRLSSWSADTSANGSGNGSANGSADGKALVPAALAAGADGHKTARRTGFADAALTVPAAGGGTIAPSTMDPAADRTVALRLGTLAGGPDDGVLMIAAGGGMAAVGAAGLGFAMLRRGRTEA